jgi:RimJ/RimL family protein N-acetyltransferase
VIANSALAGSPEAWLAVEQKGKTMLLEDALDKYPLETKLRDGTPVTVRPVARRDDLKLQKFFLTVPEEERLFIKQPITDQTLFRQWCRQPDFERNLPLLMLHKKKVIGEATLHQRSGGWKRHIGLITLLTHPEYRGRDVSKVLVTELIEMARHCGLRRLEAEVNGERKIALQVLAQLGFNKLMHLHDYVLDMHAVTHDYVLMGRSLKQEEEYAGLGG